MNHHHDKGQHYLDLLDIARSDARWQDIPELTRKVDKHAPRRTCLILTAKAEAQIAGQAHGRSIPPSRPSTSSLSQYVGSLSSAIDNERTYPEDAFQARICLAWLHFVLGASELALQRIPSDLQESYNILSSASTSPNKTRSLHICLVRGAYIKGVSSENAGRVGDAINTYDNILPLISQSHSLAATSSEYYYWTQQLLLRYCKFCSSYLESTLSNPEALLQSSAHIRPSNILKPFRTWASIVSSQTSPRPLPNSSQNSRQFWRAYYKTTSTLLVIRLVLPLGENGISNDFDEIFGFESKSRQLVELQQAEAAYEAALSRDYDFPKANEVHVEIDQFIDQVITNWQIGCSADFVGAGSGKEINYAYTKRVAATLYTSARKSFHSTRLLRHLFTVHVALSEFELASKALRSYFEIVKKGQARAEKSGKSEVGLDDEATVLTTASSAIQMLVEYGRRHEAEFANEIGEYISGWLEKHSAKRATAPSADAEDIPDDIAMEKTLPATKIAGAVIAKAYHARALAHRHWARLTYETPKRSGLYEEAVQDLRNSLQPELGSSQNLAFEYTLATALTETRKVGAAIAVLKQALSAVSQQSERRENDSSTLAMSMGLILFPVDRCLNLKCWHLMSLLLSAEQNFSAAVESCKAGIECYDEMLSRSDLSTIDVLQLSEKTSMVELQMTQLALTEVIEGPEEAVNRSDTLLGLYARLFSQTSVPKLGKPDTLIPPPSANGTVTSLRHSILGRSKKPFASLRRSRHPGRPQSGVGSNSPPSSPGELTRPPTINITDDEGLVAPQEHLDAPSVTRHSSKKLQKRESKRSVGSSRRTYNASPVRLSTRSGAPPISSTLAIRSARPNSSSTTDGASEDSVGVALSDEKPKASAVHDTATVKHLASQPSVSVYLQRLRPPEPLYPDPLAQRHSLTLLVKIWLFISSLYHRASIPADALAAILEAESHVQAIETLIATHDNSSEEAFTQLGWGGLKSVASLWADVLHARAVIKRDEGEKDLASRILEEALLWDEDHSAATVALSELLLDEYEIFFMPPAPESSARPPTLKALPPLHNAVQSGLAVNTSQSTPGNLTTRTDPSPEALSAISARDRAYYLLGQLTTSGQGWDSSEAWSAMARVWELSGEDEKAIEASWWVVELEDNRSVRSWRDSLREGC